MKRLLFGFLSLLGFVASAQAQTAVQAIPQHLDAATVVGAATAAVTTALTISIPAVAGQFFYVTHININLCQDTTGSTTLQKAVASTNLNGWGAQIGNPALAGSCNQFAFPYPNGLKSAAAGTITAITIPAPGADAAAAMTIVGYYGP